MSGGASTAGATAGRTPTQNALVGQSGRLNSRQRQDRLVVSDGRCELGISVGGGEPTTYYSSRTAANQLRDADARNQ